MKIFIILGFLIATVAAFRGYTDDHDGRPGCETEQEMHMVYWRNNENPTQYWKCYVPGIVGERHKCPQQYLYQPHLSKCVSGQDWIWSPLEDPPTLGYGLD